MHTFLTLFFSPSWTGATACVSSPTLYSLTSSLHTYRGNLYPAPFLRLQASHAVFMLPKVGEKVTIETPHISTEKFNAMGSADVVDVEEKWQRRATDTDRTELGEECVVLLSHWLRVCQHIYVGIEGLQLHYCLLSSLYRQEKFTTVTATCSIYTEYTYTLLID